MDQELKNKITELEAKIDAIYISVEKTRKYILWTVIVTILMFVLPAIGLMFVIPAFINNFAGNIQNLGL